MVVFDAGVHSEHEQVIRCNIKQDRPRDLEMLKMRQFQKNPKDIPLGLIVQTPPYFLKI
jgi:hypothetical protein